MDRSTVIPVDNETTSCISRTTTEGRTITYEMTVLQQPVRARACGQGAKSSADRRPVDPPPIVELKIFEGPDRENDITFTMHANYFLFATLEAARPIAHGRVSADRHTPPVLTGTPVAGMVYLDRPKAAGYFIFPDLSVRHEGNYRLSFSLYEELKNVKDEDKSDEESSPADAAGPFVTHRLEVKSQPFQVFSAKKFPGLTESTTLSRVVAEQGCRVRIRRDVRMRRRDQKSRAKDWDDYEDDTAAARTRMSDTPESQPYPGIMHTPHSYRDPIPRPRSTSNTSLQSHTTSLSRRPSAQDVSNAHQTNQYGGAPPPPPQTGFSQPAPYALSPAPAYQQAPYIQQPAPMQPPPPQYQPIYSAPPPPAPVTAPQQSYYGYAPSQPVQPPSSAPQPPAFEPQQQHRANVDYAVQSQAEARRYPTQPTLPPPPHAQTSFPPQQSGYPPQSTYQQPPSTQAPQSSHSHSSSMDLYSNSRPMQSQGRTTPSTSMSGHPFNLPPLQTSTAMLSSGKLEASSPSSAAPSNSYLSAVQTPVDGTHKRSYGHVFSERYQDQPLRQGARPGATASDYSLVSGHSSSAADDEDTSGELDPDSLSMHYRRADGRAIRRALPGHV